MSGLWGKAGLWASAPTAGADRDSARVAGSSGGRGLLLEICGSGTGLCTCLCHRHRLPADIPGSTGGRPAGFGCQEASFTSPGAGKPIAGLRSFLSFRVSAHLGPFQHLHKPTPLLGFHMWLRPRPRHLYAGDSLIIRRSSNSAAPGPGQRSSSRVCAGEDWVVQECECPGPGAQSTRVGVRFSLPVAPLYARRRAKSLTLSAACSHSRGGRAVSDGTADHVPRRCDEVSEQPVVRQRGLPSSCI